MLTKLFQSPKSLLRGELVNEIYRIREFTALGEEIVDIYGRLLYHTSTKLYLERLGEVLDRERKYKNKPN
jgi:hypothetical protein